jgi:uncharacterized membrane protein
MQQYINGVSSSSGAGIVAELVFVVVVVILVVDIRRWYNSGSHSGSLSIDYCSSAWKWH